MKTRYAIVMGTFIVSVILFIVLLQNPNQSNRKEYEKFLLKENTKISRLISNNPESKPIPGQPDVAAYQNYLMIIDPALKRVPVERLPKAIELTKNLAGKYKNASSQPNWQNIPANMGGRTRFLLFDPNDPEYRKVWACAATGGLWYNNDVFDNESSWQIVNSEWSKYSVSSIAFDPNNTQVFYVGTGEAETAVVTYRESSGIGAGILKSIDGGVNWELLESTINFAYVTDIAVRDENGSSTIYAAVVSGVYKGATFQSMPNDGLYRSIDGGTSWEQVLPDMISEQVPYSPSDIEIAANGKIFVGTMGNLNDDGGARILQSTTGLSGSWTLFDDYVDSIYNQTSYNIPGRVKIISSPSDENRIYALIASGSDSETVQTFRRYNCDYMLKSEDNGVSWSKINLPFHQDRNFAYLAWHALTAGVDPNNPDILYAGGLDIHRSMDGGNTWEHLSDWAAKYTGKVDKYIHADQHHVVYKPGNSDSVLFATDGGIFTTLNANVTIPIFRERNKTYNTLQFYTCAIHQNEGVKEYSGGLQDNGTVRFTGNPITVNDMISGGDGAYCFYGNNNLLITSYYNNRYYLFNNGVEIGFINAYSGTFISPADYTSGLNKIYANAVTFDGYYTDHLVRIPVPTGAHEFFSLNTGSTVPFSAVKIYPVSTTLNTTLYVGTQAGSLYKVENAQYNALSVSDITGTDFPNGNISSIDVSEDGSSILVTFSNYGVPSVWLSRNRGENWQNIENNLPDMPVRWGIFHPTNPYQAMLATEVGVWFTNSLNEGFEWQPSLDGIGYSRVDMIRMRASDETVVAATHGRGLYTTNFLTTSIDKPTQILEENAVLFPNPTKGKIFIKLNEVKSVDIMNMQGKIVRSFAQLNSNNELNISMLNNGIYFLRINAGNKVYYSKVLKY